MASLSAWRLDFSTRNCTDVRLLAQNDDARALNWGNVPTHLILSETNERKRVSEVEESTCQTALRCWFFYLRAFSARRLHLSMHRHANACLLAQDDDVRVLSWGNAPTPVILSKARAKALAKSKNLAARQHYVAGLFLAGFNVCHLCAAQPTAIIQQT